MSKKNFKKIFMMTTSLSLLTILPMTLSSCGNLPSSSTNNDNDVNDSNDNNQNGSSPDNENGNNNPNVPTNNNPFLNARLLADSIYLSSTNPIVTLTIENIENGQIDDFKIDWYKDEILINATTNTINLKISEKGIYKVIVSKDDKTYFESSLRIYYSIPQTSIDNAKINLDNLIVSLSNLSFDYNHLDSIIVSINNIDNSLMQMLNGTNKRFEISAIKDNQKIDLPISFTNNSISYQVDLALDASGTYGFKFEDILVTDPSNFAYSSKDIICTNPISINEKLIDLDTLSIKYNDDAVLNQQDVATSNSINISLQNIPMQINSLLFDFYEINWTKKDLNNQNSTSNLEDFKNKTNIEVTQDGIYTCTISRKNFSSQTKSFETKVYDLSQYKNVSVNLNVSNLKTTIGDSSNNTFNTIEFTASLSNGDSQTQINDLKLKLGTIDINLNQTNSINMNNVNDGYFYIYKTIDSKDYLVKKIAFNKWNDYKQTLIINNNSINSKTTNAIALDKSIIKSFLKDKNYKYVLINGNYNSIADSLFQDWTNLQNIVIDTTSLTTLGNNSFKGCKALVSALFIGSQTFSIGNNTFENNTSLRTINFKYRQNQSDQNNSSIKEWKPDTSNTTKSNISSIGNSAFYNASSLSSFEFDSSLTSIGTKAFSKTNLKTVDLSKSVLLTTIPAYAFWSCSNLTSVKYYSNETIVSNPVVENETTNQGISSIGNNAFDSCYSLTKIYPSSYENQINNKNNFIYLTNSITSIGSSAFKGIDIKKVEHYPTSITTIEMDTFTDVHLEDLSFLSNVTTIKNGAFSGLHVLDKDLTIPEKVETIEPLAFNSIICKSLSLPASLKFLGINALSGSQIDTLKINFSSIKSNDTNPSIFGWTTIKNIEFADNIKSFNNKQTSTNTETTGVDLTLEQLFSSIENKNNINVSIANDATNLEQELKIAGFVNITKRSISNSSSTNFVVKANFYKKND